MAQKIADVAANKYHAARLQFLSWLAENDPAIYGELMARLERSQGLGATDTTSTTTETKTPIWETLTNTLVGLYSAKQQADLIDANLKRAEQGLPPIDPTTVAPVVRTQLTVTPEMAAELKAGTDKYLKVALIGGGLLAAFLLLR